ncbi:MAG: ABC transporter permease [Treponema sp.]|nr:ABC transporter permease [Candidatus Treponema scatequi]
MLDFFTGVLSSSYYTGLFLNMFVLMSFSAIGNCISLKSGFYNLGGEGQIYLSGFVAAICLVKFSFLPPVLNVTISLLISVLSSCTLELISALINDFKKVDVLLTTYLLSSASIFILDYLVGNVFRTKEGNLLATDFIDESVRLKSILPPSPLNVLIFAVPVLCVVFWFLQNKTMWGKRSAVWGISNEFAIYSGFSYRKNIYSLMAVDGVLHGFTGFAAVIGTYFTCHQSFSSGMGWNALTCALLAGKNPLLVIPSGLFLSWLYTSSSRYSLIHNFGFDMAGIIQGLVIFFVAANMTFAEGGIKKTFCKIKIFVKKIFARKEVE